MKKVVSILASILALILALGFVSCTDNTEIVEKQTQSNEKISSTKDDSTTPESDGGEEPDNGEG
ncbi:hypothetical protein [uncultured Tenacibaculum sp.]|uniref:hypothetical protein n=1 Tax=uncultured Tenacibaculum sp. TaxID=174713 RepID=UPI002622C65B|nr:hypothetical protein [uncultured Tenacibaculum sp.]